MIFEQWNFIDDIDESILTDALDIKELIKVFDIDFSQFADTDLGLQARDFFKKKKKKLRFMQNETVKWIFNFLLSEQLANYLKKAHSVYVLVSNSEKKDHEKFFEGMLIISEGVKNSSQYVDFVVAINGSYLRIDQIRRLLNDNRDLFSDNEYAFFAGSLTNIVLEKQRHFSDFELVSTDNKLQMEDGERIKLIDRLTQVAGQSDEALHQLAIMLRQMVSQRGYVRVDLAHVQQLYGIE